MDWLSAIVGAVLGYLLPMMVGVVALALRHTRKDPLEGNWHVYHPTFRSGVETIEHSRWRISKALGRRLSLETYRDSTSKSPLYRGSIAPERNYLVANFKAIGHEENVVVRVNSPLRTADDLTCGLYMCLDFEGRPMAGPVVVSRAELSDPEVRLHLEKCLVADTPLGLLRAR